MGWDAACKAITDALAADPGMAAVAVKPNPVDQFTADLTLMVYPMDAAFSAASLDGYWATGNVRIALHKKASDTASGGITTDIAVLRPYIDTIARVLAAASAGHFAGTVAATGSETSPWLTLAGPISPDTFNGLDTVSLRLALNVTLAEESWA